MRKRSKGIIIYSLLGIVFSLVILWPVAMKAYYFGFRSLNIWVKMQIGLALYWMVFGIGVLLLKSWARLGLIMLSIFHVIHTFNLAISFIELLKKYPLLGGIIVFLLQLFFISMIFFFTRPKVKEQFKTRVTQG